MNEAGGVLIGSLAVAICAVILLPLSMLRLSAKARDGLSAIARVNAIVSAVLLLCAFLLRGLWITFLDNAIMFVLPMLGLAAGFVWARAVRDPPTARG